MTTAEKFIEAIKIFMSKDPSFYFQADHDVIYGPAYRMFDEEETKKLEELGWHKGDYETFDYFC